jgi:hypothetical protein
MKELKNSEKKKKALENHRFGDIYYISVDQYYDHYYGGGKPSVYKKTNDSRLMILPKRQPSFNIKGIEMLKDNNDCNGEINIQNRKGDEKYYNNLVKMINISHELRIGKLDLEQYNRIIEMFFSKDVVQRQMIIDILNNLE